LRCDEISFKIIFALVFPWILLECKIMIFWLVSFYLDSFKSCKSHCY
jgi:hypothetical protein